MTLHERTGQRDLLYSAWHRPDSIRRFLTAREAATLKLIDIDWCEACQFCSQPLALVETQRSSGPPKAATITLILAQLADVAAYSVSYVPNADGSDIERFRRKRLWPPPIVSDELSPAEYARFLVDLRDAHYPLCERRAA